MEVGLFITVEVRNQAPSRERRGSLVGPEKSDIETSFLLLCLCFPI